MNSAEKITKDALKLIYNATYMPMHYSKNNETISVFPNWSINILDCIIYQNDFEHTQKSFDYYVSNDYLYIGIVRNIANNESVIVGPVSLAPLTPENIEKIIKVFADSEASYQRIKEYFERTPYFSLSRFLNTMALINTVINHEIIDVEKYYKAEISTLKNEVGRTYSDAIIDRKENENYHNTYFFEQEYYGYVEKGDVDGLTEFSKIIPSLTEGAMASDSIRHSKNIFITAITLATRHAINGGLDIETAYQLSDSYIQEMEKMSDSAAITMLLDSAIFDYTRRVSDAKMPKDMSVEIFKCIQYISNHVNQNISIEQLAEMLHIDRSTLSKKFKRELGFNISNFIMHRKLEEAKTLLRYTDKSVSEISAYLCFSSQAYFQNVFKKKYGVTPRNFRLNF